MKIDDAIMFFEKAAEASARLGTEKLELGAIAHIAYGTYSQIAEWLKELKQRRTIDAVSEWIPCSERLPEDSGDYLVCPSDSVLEDYSDFSEVMIMPYDADCEAFGWWTERYDSISLGYVDSDFNEFEVLAWMTLPKPYGERKESE